jgi:hypothetical protein
VRGESTSSDGVLGRASAAGMAGVRGSNPDAAGWAGYFQGRVGITGTLECTGCVAHDDLATGAVMQGNLSATGAAFGKVLGTDGSTLRWQNDGLTLPYVGYTSTSAGYAAFGITSNDTAIEGSSTAAGAAAVLGWTSGDSGYGVQGVSQNFAAYGVSGVHNPTGNYGYLGGNGFAVYGHNNTTQSSGGLGGGGVVGDYGVVGECTSGVDGSAGVKGTNAGSQGVGVWGEHAGDGWGVFGGSPTSHAVHGSTTDGVGIYGVAWGSGYAGAFDGNVDVTGTLTKGGGAFRIDHPLDPENRYLAHSFVESPDMMNIYNGNIVTDTAGEAIVTLPDYFSALNRDFRYQLTVIGEFAQAIVGREIEGNFFTIRTSKPNVRVSWQVTGIRQDRWANAHRITVEQDKPEKARGFYLHPDLYDQPEERGVAAALWPDAVGNAKASAVKPRSAQQAKQGKQQ